MRTAKVFLCEIHFSSFILNTQFDQNLMWYDADSASWISCLYSRQGMPYSPEATPRQITIHDCARPSQLLRASYCRRRILVLPHRRYRDETTRTRVVHRCCRNAWPKTTWILFASSRRNDKAVKNAYFEALVHDFRPRGLEAVIRANEPTSFTVPRKT